MNRLCKGLGPAAIAVHFLIAMSALAMGAAIGVTWTKSEVIPVVLVKPGIGGGCAGGRQFNRKHVE